MCIRDRSCLALPCLALPSPALPCLALSCPVLPCPVLPCLALFLPCLLGCRCPVELGRTVFHPGIAAAREAQGYTPLRGSFGDLAERHRGRVRSLGPAQHGDRAQGRKLGPPDKPLQDHLEAVRVLPGRPEGGHHAQADRLEVPDQECREDLGQGCA
eukprot:2449445-Alexandrium_andersonii.AAC.1